MDNKPTFDTSNEYWMGQNVDTEALAQEKLHLAQLARKPLLGKAGGYFKLSGPGWIQSALSLGGGSGSLSLFAGALAGYALMWVNPASMFFGVIMLGAMAYMTLSTGTRPFHAINQHVSPILGWAWVISVLIANFVWIFGQFNVSASVAGDVFTLGGVHAPEVMVNLGQWLFADVRGNEAAGLAFGAVFCPLVAMVSLWVAWHYGKGTRGVRWFEKMMKVVVAGIICCFVIVVVRTDTDYLGVLKGFFRFELPSIHETDKLDIVISAFAAAVGINMTFVFPYTLLARGWGREHRGLAGFDLGCGMFIPFVFAVSCLTIAAGNTLHSSVLPEVEAKIAAIEVQKQALENDQILSPVQRQERFTELDAAISAAKAPLRNAVSMARSLEPLLGERLSHIVFGLGFLGMTTSSIITMMLVSGFALAEICNQRPGEPAFKIGILIPALGMFGPLVFGAMQMWLMVPISVFCFFFTPVAYVTFFILMNKRSFLGEHMPRGSARLAWNAAMLLAIVVVTAGGAYKLASLYTQYLG